MKNLERSWVSLPEQGLSVYACCDPDYLRQWRYVTGWSDVVLARKSSLSVGQIRQLTLGGDSLFYSPAAKRVAYRHLLQILGAPACEIRQAEMMAVHAMANGMRDEHARHQVEGIALLCERSVAQTPTSETTIGDVRTYLLSNRQTLCSGGFLLFALLLLTFVSSSVPPAAG